MPHDDRTELKYQIALTMVVFYIICPIQALGEKLNMDIGVKLNKMDTVSQEMTGGYYTGFLKKNLYYSLSK